MALLIPFVGSSVAEEPVEDEGAVSALPGTFKVLVRTRNSEGLSEQVDQLVQMYSQVRDDAFFRIFNIPPNTRAKRKLLTLHESVRPALLDEFKRFDRVRWTQDPSAKDIRYILDYVVSGYMAGKDNSGRLVLQTNLQLIVQDVLKDEVVLEKTLVILKDFRSDDDSILDDFYQEAALTVAQEVSPLFD
ncbi:MAG: hypothetical protein F4Z57_04640 [Gemmatimonadetes bacterium]|nr:hypothetical protein [Gemmatimonadota bacterium]